MTDSYDLVVDSALINSALSLEDFDFPFPEGTIVRDRVALEDYVVGKSGEKILIDRSQRVRISAGEAIDEVIPKKGSGLRWVYVLLLVGVVFFAVLIRLGKKSVSALPGE